MRVLLCGAALLIIAPMVWMIYFRDKADPCVRDPARCPPRHSAMEPVAALKIPGQPLTEYVRIPCAFVGTWVSTGDNGTYKLDLNENGTYATHLSHPGHGLWGVQGNTMLWHIEDDSGKIVRVDTEPISLASADRFLLQEANRSFAIYEFLDPRPRTRCSKE
jgi:hypothetical protein